MIQVSDHEAEMLDSKVAVEAEFTLLRKQIMGIKRRKAERFRCPIASLGKLTMPDASASVEVWCKNLSVTGVGINLAKPLEVGTEVIIQLKSVDQNVHFRKPSRVAHTTQELDGTWRLGCEFREPLSDDELDSLL